MNIDFVSEMAMLSKLDSSKRMELLATIKEIRNNPGDFVLKEVLIHLNHELKEINDSQKEHWYAYKKMIEEKSANFLSMYKSDQVSERRVK
ncbi:hypothetical protein ABER75_10820 [Niallia taxi]|uniref:hypothetical protein n=1 Tax=Niallia taxi TaxID=2499688 RepID=UPI003D2B6AB4